MGDFLTQELCNALYPSSVSKRNAGSKLAIVVSSPAAVLSATIAPRWSNPMDRTWMMIPWIARAWMQKAKQAMLLDHLANWAATGLALTPVDVNARTNPSVAEERPLGRHSTPRQ